MPRTPGSWIGSSRSPWTPCDCLREMLWRPRFRAVSDAESVAWLERHLQEYPGTVVSVTHDRYFLDNVAQWILELDHGHGIPWKGNYSSWLEQKQERVRREEKAESERQKTLQRELEWIRMSPKARRAKG